MTSNERLDNVTQKIKKLLKLAERAGTPEEAATAAAQAAKLMAQHRISSAALEAAGDKSNAEQIDKNGTTLHKGAKLDRWLAWLAMSVADANACFVYVSGGDIQIVGRPSDMQATSYVFAYLKREIDFLADKTGAGQGRTWRNNFRLGCVETISTRLENQKEEARKDAYASAAASVAKAEGRDLDDGDDVQDAEEAEESRMIAADSEALVKLDRALAVVDTHARELEAVHDSMKLKKKKAHRSNYDPSARNAGREAGKRVSLNRNAGGLGTGSKRVGGGR